MIDFIYFCIFCMVPDKALLGKREVACTFFSTFTTFLLLSIIIWIQFYTDIQISNFNMLLIISILFIGAFILSRIYFLNESRFNKMILKTHKLSIIWFKIFGILYILFCFISFIASLMILTMIKRKMGVS